MLKNYNECFGLRIGNAGIISRGLEFIEKGKEGTLKKDMAEIERIVQALIRSLENKPLNP